MESAGLRRRRTSLLLGASGAALALLVACSNPDSAGPSQGPTAPTTPAATASEPDPEPSPQPEPTPERASDPSWDPHSIHVLVNPQNPLDPLDYEPHDLVEPDVRITTETPQLLREESAEALEELFAAIRAEGMELAMTSAYRSYDQQWAIYEDRAAEYGTESTDEAMARPGHSEHQTGLAADVISIDNPDCIHGDCFAETPEGRWVAENAHESGFVIRYPEGAEDITGYQYEPWHLRYVGVDTAQEVFEEDVTLEEYWEQPAAAEYSPSQEDPQEGPAEDSEDAEGSAQI
ncbi:D-alanyl-D-alanine carboxypeptidase family protein [Nesterenkonia lacusekhoensis]|uniref:D-alanyl-D-alanine carboxypeptidase n=1 Tax=Nesterenkonia lacusekhoensis TaxID=150832 RepID=A0ABS4SZS3_9MICC|nr:M15 family metallopeptidase [Nesterenkonia lacusekhoensis]MBP2317229.1 D-alanyl-D-alanine carboxypeptidase [Nesterenkonia lacusekhoensis]